MLKEFDFIAAPNEETLIYYFRDSLCSSIQALVDNQGWDLDAWKVVEKAVNAEAKAGLQPHSMIKEIDSRYPKKYRPLVKKDKDDAYQEHRNKVFNKDKKKAKSHPSFSANQLETQASKKDKHHQRWQGHPATGVNTIKVAKKDKDKIKDLSHIECYICKQKDYYANKCPKKPKNHWRSWRPPRWWLRRRRNWSRYLAFGISLLSKIKSRPC